MNQAERHLYEAILIWGEGQPPLIALLSIQAVYASPSIHFLFKALQDKRIENVPFAEYDEECIYGYYTDHKRFISDMVRGLVPDAPDEFIKLILAFDSLRKKRPRKVYRRILKDLSPKNSACIIAMLECT